MCLPTVHAFVERSEGETMSRDLDKGADMWKDMRLSMSAGLLAGRRVVIPI